MKKKILIMMVLLATILTMFGLANSVKAEPCTNCSEECKCEAENCACASGEEKTCVAQIISGETTTCYDDLHKALTAVKAGEKIKLVNDITETSTYFMAKDCDFTLDLNGKTITLNGGSVVFYVALHTVTFEDSAGTGKIENQKKLPVVQVYSNGTAIINGGSYISESANAFQIGNTDNNPAKLIVNKCKEIKGQFGISITGNASTLEINGGTITGSSAAVSGNYNDTHNATVTIKGGTLTSTGGTAIYLPNSGTVTITKGTFTGKYFGIVNRCSTVTITGGTFKGEDANDTLALGTEEPGIPTGYAIVVDNNTEPYTSSPAKVIISGGKFNEAAAENSLLSWTGEGSKDINKTDFLLTGGTYKSDVTACVEDGYKCTGSGTTWTVSKISTGGSTTPTPSVDNIVVEEVDKTGNNAVEGTNASSQKEVILETLKEELKDNTELARKLQGKTAKVDIEFSEVSASVEKEVKDKIEEAAKKANKEIKMAEYYDIDIAVLADGEVVGHLKELTKEIELKVSIPENLPEVAKGYTRKYYIIRDHEGEVTVLDTNVLEDGKTITFKSDRFSTYALGYSDEKIDNSSNSANLDSTPKTGDHIMLVVGVLLTLSIATYVYISKRSH